jgi:Mg/Co/Ni transporter MgtE
MKCTENQYKKFTIKSLLNSLEEIMARNPEITLDSEVIISDINMSSFKQEIKVYPTHDYKDEKMKVGIYLNPYEKDELLDTVEEEELTEVMEEVNPQNAQAVQELKHAYAQKKSQPIQAESHSLSWLDKYARR